MATASHRLGSLAGRRVPRRRFRVIEGGARGVRAARLRRIRFAVLTASVFAVGVFALVLLNVMVAQGSFRLEDLRNDVGRQTSFNRQLRADAATATSPVRLRESAEELGLVVADEQRWISVP